MKKVYLFLLVFLCLVLIGCETKIKEAGSIGTFYSIATENNFVVSDNMNNYTDVNYINSSMIAIMDDISIEMINYSSVDDAINVQEYQISGFEKYKGSGAIIKKDKGQNYYKYIMISNGYYMVSSRIDNNLIFCRTLLKNSDTVENILNLMGY